MAIDDNTTYGLTGAQVKELPERINAVKGMAKVLTTDDYNYPADNPTSVGLWLLPEGFYAQQTGVNVRVNSISTVSSSKAAYFLVGKEDAGGKTYITAFSDDSVRYYTVNHSSGSSVNEKNLYTTIRDSLTSTSTTAALSANQGKVLKDLVDSLAIRGAGAPTASTVGQVGTLYEDTTNGDLYICTDATNPYVWEEVGAGGGGPTVVQTTGTSTTDVMSQNAVTTALSNKADTSAIPTATSDLTNDGSDGTSTYVEADELASVATSGSYNDLTNKPTIPTVNNATLTIQANGTTVNTFTANASSNVTANIPSATTSRYGVTQLSDSTSSTSTTLAATSSAVKSAYDLAGTKAKITMSSTDPGEGVALAENEFIAVYDSNS